MKKRSINISTADNYISVEHPRSNTSWVVSKTPQVISILQSKSTHFTRNTNGRFRAKLSYAGKYHNKKQPYLSTLMFGCYRCGVTAKNLHTTIPKLMASWNNSQGCTTKSERANKKLNVEHLDENKYNNTKYNLSLMSFEINRQKQGLPLQFKDIFNLILAYDDDGRYRIQFTYTTKGKVGEGRTIRYYCDTPDELLDMLKYLCEHKYAIRNAKIGVLIDSDIYKISTIKRFGIFTPIHLIKPLYETYEIQEYIAHMPICDFGKWKGKINNVE